MTNTIIIDRRRRVLIIAGKLYFYKSHIYRIGDKTHKDYPGGSSPYICHHISKLASNSEYSIYRADFCEIHGNGEMSEYFVNEEVGI